MGKTRLILDDGPLVTYEMLWSLSAIVRIPTVRWPSKPGANTDNNLRPQDLSAFEAEPS